MTRDMRYFGDEPLPGSDRERKKYGAMPTLAGEVLAGPKTERFPFLSWAMSARFDYPKAATNLLAGCESAPEAYFARAFVTQPGITFNDGAAVRHDGTTLRTQAKHGMIRVDFVVQRGSLKLAVEVDGFTHHSKHDQMAADYLRARRIVALGYIIVRFTAQEVFTDATECWKQVDAVLAAHSHPKAS